MTRPSRTVGIEMTLKGVSHLPRGFSSCHRNFRNLAKSPGTAGLVAAVLFMFRSRVCPVLVFAHFALSVREHIEREQESGHAELDQRDGDQEFSRELGIRGVAEIRSEADLVERHSGEVKPSGPSHFILTVDLVHVLVRVAVYTMACDLHQFSFWSEHERVGGACFYTSRLLTLLQSVVAHRAFHYSRIGRVIFGLRNVERARHHAEPAPHALVAVPRHGTLPRLDHGVDETGRCARRLPAMHALLLDEDLALACLEAVYDRELLLC